MPNLCNDHLMIYVRMFCQQTDSTKIPFHPQEEEERWLNLRRRGGSMVAHLTANQQSWVQIQLLPSTRKTLSVLRWVATWDDTAQHRGGRGTYTQKPIKIYREKKKFRFNRPGDKAITFPHFSGRFSQFHLHLYAHTNTMHTHNTVMLDMVG